MVDLIILTMPGMEMNQNGGGLSFRVAKTSLFERASDSTKPIMKRSNVGVGVIISCIFVSFIVFTSADRLSDGPQDSQSATKMKYESTSHKYGTKTHFFINPQLFYLLLPGFMAFLFLKMRYGTRLRRWRWGKSTGWGRRWRGGDGDGDGDGDGGWRCGPILMVLTMGMVMTLSCRYDTWKLQKRREDALVTLKKTDTKPLSEEEEEEQLGLQNMAFEKEMFPHMTPEIRMQMEAQMDPELRPIATLIGKDLSVEEYGRINFKILTDRQLQALGFSAGCPFLACPQFKDMAPAKVARICGFKPHEIVHHKKKQISRLHPGLPKPAAPVNIVEIDDGTADYAAAATSVDVPDLTGHPVPPIVQRQQSRATSAHTASS